MKWRAIRKILPAKICYTVDSILGFYSILLGINFLPLTRLQKFCLWRSSSATSHFHCNSWGPKLTPNSEELQQKRNILLSRTIWSNFSIYCLYTVFTSFSIYYWPVNEPKKTGGLFCDLVLPKCSNYFCPITLFLLYGIIEACQACMFQMCILIWCNITKGERFANVTLCGFGDQILFVIFWLKTSASPQTHTFSLYKFDIYT